MSNFTPTPPILCMSNTWQSAPGRDYLLSQAQFAKLSPCQKLAYVWNKNSDMRFLGEDIEKCFVNGAAISYSSAYCLAWHSQTPLELWAYFYPAHSRLAVLAEWAKTAREDAPPIPLDFKPTIDGYIFPTLAIDADLEAFNPAWAPAWPTPMLLSPKLDGVRITVQNGQALTRSGKPFPNPLVQKLFGHLEGVDGELIADSPTAPGVFKITQSLVMSKNNQGPLTLYAFDLLVPCTTLEGRLNQLKTLVLNEANVRLIPQTRVENDETLAMLEQRYLNMGYEGLVLRNPHLAYKPGRACAEDGAMFKIKRHAHGEAFVLGMQPLVGKREKLYPEVGSLQVRDVQTGQEFSLGSGFSRAERELLWQVGQQLNGSIVRYRYTPTAGHKRPRFPVFAGFRSTLDMGEVAHV